MNSLRNGLNKLSYLSPNRAGPLRGYPRPPRSVTDIGHMGQWTADYLLRRGAVERSYCKPPEIPADPASAGRQLDVPWAEQESLLAVAVNFWMQHLRLAKRIDVEDAQQGRELRLNACVAQDHPARPLTDVGFGLSQALPIIVAGLGAADGGLLVVEQPEAQLHPLPQALLADFFCSLVKSGRRALVETHSEAFFHRLRLWAALDDDLAKKIAVYFIAQPAPDGCCQQPQPVPLTDDDHLNWPPGFLMEGLDEELCIAAARTARSRRSPDADR